MDEPRPRWEYKHLILNFDVTSDEGWRQLQVAGGEGWEAVAEGELRRKEARTVNLAA